MRHARPFLSRQVLTFLGGVIVLAAGCSRPDPRFLGSGTMDAREVTLSADFGGPIVSLALHEGQAVQQGQLLGQIDSSKIKAQLDELAAQQSTLAAEMNGISAQESALALDLRSAEAKRNEAFASHRLARADLARVMGLYRGGGTTRQQVDTARTADETSRDSLPAASLNLPDIATQRQGLAAKSKGLAAQRQALAARRELLDIERADARLIAPTSGIVEKKFVERGEMAELGSPICAIADLLDMWVRVYLDERTLAKIAVGAKVVVDAMGKPFDGVVEAISPDAEFTPKQVETRDVDATLVYGVKVRISHPGLPLRIGMPVEVRLP